MKTKLYLSPQDVEDLYSIKVSTLNVWRCQGKGPDYFKMGGLVRYSAEEVKKFFERHRVRCFRKGEIE